MNYGIQISASGALTSIHQQDAMTGNLANLETVGFKPIFAATRFRQGVRSEDGVHNLPSNALLEKLGAGVMSAHNRINFAQGAITPTSSHTDLAIEGSGFFVVAHEGGTALTRDGRLALNESGTLVQASTGRAILDSNDNPITVDLNGGDISVATDGTVSQRGSVLGQIALADVADRSELTKHGEGLFVSQYGTPLSMTDALGVIRQNAIEASAVNEIDAIMRIQSAARSAQGNIGMIDMQNRLMDRTINTFGRIA